MRALIQHGPRLALVAGAALAVSACGDNTVPPNNLIANDVGANLSFDMPANDASAMESVGNAAAMPPAPEPTNSSGADNSAGTTTGGDTGGNSGVESNVSGM